jgi:hypothetical protein
MTRLRWSKWFWDDWENDPALKLCQLASQGLWMRMLCLAARHDPIGYVCVGDETPSPSTLARLFNVTVEEVTAGLLDLEEHGVFSRDRKKRIYSRRLVRDSKISAHAQRVGKLGGNPSLVKQKEISAQDNPVLRAIARDARSASASDSASQVNGYGGLGEKEEGLRPVPKSTSEFDTWYHAYPLHRSRGQAERAFTAARRIASLEVLLEGVRRYIATKRPDRDWKYPATWLNGKCWLDEPEPMPAAGNPRTSTGPPGDDDRLSAENRDFMQKRLAKWRTTNANSKQSSR